MVRGRRKDKGGRERESERGKWEGKEVGEKGKRWYNVGGRRVGWRGQRRERSKGE